MALRGRGKGRGRGCTNARVLEINPNDLAMERALQAQVVPEGQRVEFATYLLTGEASHWWQASELGLKIVVLGYDLKVYNATHEAMLALPLTKLTRKDTPFVWTTECEERFQALKKKLTTTPVLVLPELNEPFEVYCDASLKGLGCMLM
ncbi:uncharacterized protein LOC130976395 [Arachis stenosperma]|uniref:uncharacterized protein LOC130976395 n=1 Tax=Arachis stenosperma TaxID=217475 RepID=UPI0025AC3D06|nr:uncharacterized protein LOC130976395 [Arachis stenosperma]